LKNYEINQLINDWLKIFGTSKLQIAGVPEILVDIIRRYDLAFLQEIRNADGTAIVQLFNLMNQGLDVPYKMIVSDKLGRTTSTEQYAYFYKTDRVSFSPLFLANVNLYISHPFHFSSF